MEADTTEKETPAQTDTPLATEQSSAASRAATSPVKRADTKDYIKDGFSAKTKGESLFNKLVYGGVGFGIVTGVSIFATWLLRDSKTVSKQYSKLVEGVQNWWVKGRNLSPEEIKKTHNAIDSAMTIGALFTGGTFATVLPIKALEDNKASIVRDLDTRIYGAEKVASDLEIQAAHKELDIAPKQTWKSVFWSRVVAFIGTFTVWGIIGENSRPLADKLGGSIDSLSVKAGRNIDGWMHKKDSPARNNIEYMKQASPKDMRRKPNPAEGINSADALSTRIWTYVTQDGLYTALTSALLFVSTRVLGPFFDKPHVEESAESPPAITHPTAPEATPAPRTPSNEKTTPTAKVENVKLDARLERESAQALGA